eukprot:TRINITY_DN14393_c0_g6_i1.p1 TRINITY_DN14393_c0_g6~~TRINITY_DN14393_c0_g6_i1.p1  ORF type:complete len:874 (-),score=96.11 TRINITY_DN14393_c0_g6_i1:277-2517(-)
MDQAGARCVVAPPMGVYRICPCDTPDASALSLSCGFANSFGVKSEPQIPTFEPTTQITREPTPQPSSSPTLAPETPSPTHVSSPSPTPMTRPRSPQVSEVMTHATPAPTKEEPTPSPTSGQTPEPTAQPSTAHPTREPTHKLGPKPSLSPTREPTGKPPSNAPTPESSMRPTPEATREPKLTPTERPTPHPSHEPTPGPSSEATLRPTGAPSRAPTSVPSPKPTPTPTFTPTSDPTASPSYSPTPHPTPTPKDCGCDDFRNQRAVARTHLCETENSLGKFCQLPSELDGSCPRDFERCMHTSSDSSTVYIDYSMEMNALSDFDEDAFVTAYKDAAGKSTNMRVSIQSATLHFEITERLVFSSISTSRSHVRDLIHVVSEHEFGKHAHVDVVVEGNGNLRDSAKIVISVIIYTADADFAGTVFNQLKKEGSASKFGKRCKASLADVDAMPTFQHPIAKVKFSLAVERKIPKHDVENVRLLLDAEPGVPAWRQGLPDDTAVAASYERTTGKKVVVSMKNIYLGRTIEPEPASSGGGAAIGLMLVLLGLAGLGTFVYLRKKQGAARSLEMDPYATETKPILEVQSAEDARRRGEEAERQAEEAKRRAAEAEKKARARSAAAAAAAKPGQANRLDIEFKLPDETIRVLRFCYRPVGMTFQPSLPMIVKEVKADGEAAKLGVKPGWTLLRLRAGKSDWSTMPDKEDGEKTYQSVYRDLAMSLKELDVMPGVKLQRNSISGVGERNSTNSQA